MLFWISCHFCIVCFPTSVCASLVCFMTLQCMISLSSYDWRNPSRHLQSLRSDRSVSTRHPNQELFLGFNFYALVFFLALFYYIGASYSSIDWTALYSMSIFLKAGPFTLAVMRINCVAFSSAFKVHFLCRLHWVRCNTQIDNELLRFNFYSLT